MAITVVSGFTRSKISRASLTTMASRCIPFLHSSLLSRRKKPHNGADTRPGCGAFNRRTYLCRRSDLFPGPEPRFFPASERRYAPLTASRRVLRGPHPRLLERTVALNHKALILYHQILACQEGKSAEELSVRDQALAHPWHNCWRTTGTPSGTSLAHDQTLGMPLAQPWHKPGT